MKRQCPECRDTPPVAVIAHEGNYFNVGSSCKKCNSSGYMPVPCYQCDEDALEIRNEIPLCRSHILELDWCADITDLDKTSIGLIEAISLGWISP